MTKVLDVERANFSVLDPTSGKPKGAPIDVHFNPVSLQFSITNQLDPQQRSKDKKQYVKESSGKLTMDLVFDTTDTGQNVRGATGKIAAFMQPDAKHVPPMVRFEWGAFAFQGIVESYKETIDFFSSNGVPLRASVNLTLSDQQKVFDQNAATGSRTADVTGGLTPSNTVEVPPADPSSVASQAGDPRAASAIAALNGLESLRFPSGPLVLDASASLRGPVAFASGGAGLGLSASAGAGLSVGGGLSAGASAGFGASASAGISASAGAFAGLRTDLSANASNGALDTSSLFSASGSVNVATDQGARFSVGGRAIVEGSAGISANVGVDASLLSSASLRFDA